MIIPENVKTSSVQDCLGKSSELLIKLSKDFDIKDYPVDAPLKKKEYIKSTLEYDPFRIFVGEDYGGYGGDIKESLSLLSLASYHSLQLTLVYGINWALFIQPLQKYGTDIAKEEILNKVSYEKKIGGLMITEPDYGSDALNMKTNFSKVENGYHIEGQKHWGGLSGIADYWVLTCRENKGEGKLSRDIGFFINDNNATEQRIKTTQYYNTGGLEIITYGLNQLDIIVPEHYRFTNPMTGIKMMLDCLHRSRIQFSGMGMGYMKRLLEEAINHCEERKVGNKKLIEYDKVKERLVTIQSAFTINSAMCHYASKTTQLEKDLSGLGLEANCVKSLLTDLMQESAQSLVQLKGGNGYNKDNIAGRAIMDSRPFQIFEGSNDILYIQIGEAIIKKMQKGKFDNFRALMSDIYPYMNFEPCIELLNQVKIPEKADQQKVHSLGEIFASIFSLDLLGSLSSAGYNQDLIMQANLFIVKRIKGLITKIRCVLTPELLQDFSLDSDWTKMSD